MVSRFTFLGLLLCAASYASAQTSPKFAGNAPTLSTAEQLSVATPGKTSVTPIAAISVAPAVATSAPIVRPGGGTYTTTQILALSSATPGATICYAYGSLPSATHAGTCSAGSRYIRPISLSASHTLHVLTTKAGYINSPMVTNTYIISKSIPSGSGSAITACGSITAPGSYHLANDVDCSTTGFSIQAANVKFDLNGHTIHYGNSSTSLSAISLCDPWYDGGGFPIDHSECKGGSYSGLEIFGGVITENANAAPFSHALILGQGNGLGGLGGYIHDLTVNIGCGGGRSTCVGAQFIHGDYPGGNWKITNNVINDTVTNIEKPGQGALGARSQYQGYAIHIDDGANSSSRPDYYEYNTFNGTPQGGIADSIQNTTITSNTCHLSSDYSNDYCAILTARGMQATYNNVSGRGRGFSIEESGITVSNNTISLHEEANNSEYGGCELGGAYGIRIKDFNPIVPLTGIKIEYNKITVDGTNCEARAFTITNSYPGATATIAGNSFLTTGSANATYGLKLNSFNQSPFDWSANTIGGQYCVEIGNDGDIGSGANAVIGAGQTWNCGSTSTVIDKDLGRLTSGQTYSQALTIHDTVSNPSVACYQSSSAMVKIGSYSHQC